MVTTMVSKINKLAGYAGFNMPSSMKDLHICERDISNLTDDAIENGTFQQGTDEVLELLVNAIQGRHAGVLQFLPGDQAPTKDWILWLLSKGPFKLWTCRQTDGDLILAQAKITAEEVYAAIFTLDTGMRHSKRIKERHGNELKLTQNETTTQNEHMDLEPATNDIETQETSGAPSDRIHMEVEGVLPLLESEESGTHECKNINTFLGSEARKKATNKRKSNT